MLTCFKASEFGDKCLAAHAAFPPITPTHMMIFAKLEALLWFAANYTFHFWKFALPANWRHVISSTKSNNISALHTMSHRMTSGVMKLTASRATFWRPMNTFVFLITRTKLQILKSVIVASLVDVMNHLTTFQKTSNSTFYKQTCSNT
jgi:hypothetical protein